MSYSSFQWQVAVQRMAACFAERQRSLDEYQAKADFSKPTWISVRGTERRDAGL
jgi:hypothetical protein